MLKDQLNILISKTKSALRLVVDKSKQDLKTLWANDKLIIVLLGAVILLIKFRDILIDILVSSSKRELTKAQNQDAVLAKQENAANEQADDLVKKASQEGQGDAPVDAEWYKK